ncbi:unnamed protein product [Dicrocoelium dendriticum]|nr:unnamed protein product [Dicrocoelium dendriticum]
MLPWGPLDYGRRCFQQYCMCLAIYMCEPWEQVMVHTIMLAVAIVIIYSAILFIPSHTTTFITFLLECLRS